VGFQRPGGKGDRLERKYDDSQPPLIFVSKTLADLSPAAINYFKVKSGILKNDVHSHQFNRNIPETFSSISRSFKASSSFEVGELRAGDIGAIAKLEGNDHRRTPWRQSFAHLFTHPRSFPSPPLPLPSSRKPAADERQDRRLHS